MNVRKTSQFGIAWGLAALTLTLLILALSTQSAQAQGDSISVDKRLERADPVVYVGEYLTFSIRIVNQTPYTVTSLPLSDTYNALVLGYADAVPSPDRVDEGAGRLDWNDLTDYFGDLPPGGQIEVVVGFIAEHPDTAIVNAAEVHDAIGSSGALSGTDSTSWITESIGGSSPVDKTALGELIHQVGQPITFTITITNNGYTTLTLAPLVDHYNPAWLQFSYAVPPPDTVDEIDGDLIWNDLTLWTGDIPAQASVQVTTVFTGLTILDNLVANSAYVSGALDWYENDLGAGADEVPITIIQPPAPTSTPAPPPTATPAPPPPPPQPPTPAPPTATAPPTPTPTPPFFLPESGRQSNGLSLWVAGAVIAIGLGFGLLARSGRAK